MTQRCIIHCHSKYSHDSNLSLEKIVSCCQRFNINTIALTDHNTIAGAIKLKQIAPSWLNVIIGEEIMTAEGDLIGLFLTKHIPPRLPIGETIKKIREQNGVIILPHPLDRLRHEAVGLIVTERIKNKIDFIETFNSRCILNDDNKKAVAFAKQNNIAQIVGADAHLISEYGNAICIMESFDNSKELFIQNLTQATFSTKPAGLFVHVFTKIDKWKKIH